MPGWVNEIKPARMTLQSGLRYHLVNLDTGLVDSATSSDDWSFRTTAGGVDDMMNRVKVE